MRSQRIRKWICDGRFSYMSAQDAFRVEGRKSVKLHEYVEGHETRKRPVDYLSDDEIIAEYDSGERTYNVRIEDSPEQQLANSIAAYYTESRWNNPMEVVE